jgi:cytoskeletal protein RodZ
MEQDDFSMCGGDAYAKGHLRTLAPILGLDPDALVSAYEGESH